MCKSFLKYSFCIILNLFILFLTVNSNAYGMAADCQLEPTEENYIGVKYKALLVEDELSETHWMLLFGGSGFTMNGEYQPHFIDLMIKGSWAAIYEDELCASGWPPVQQTFDNFTIEFGLSDYEDWEAQDNDIGAWTHDPVLFPRRYTNIDSFESKAADKIMVEYQLDVGGFLEGREIEITLDRAEETYLPQDKNYFMDPDLEGVDVCTPNSQADILYRRWIATLIVPSLGIESSIDFYINASQADKIRGDNTLNFIWENPYRPVIESDRFKVLIFDTEVKTVSGEWRKATRFLVDYRTPSDELPLNENGVLVGGYRKVNYKGRAALEASFGYGYTDYVVDGNPNDYEPNNTKAVIDLSYPDTIQHEEASIFTAEIKATGQSGDASNVKIGIDFNGKAYLYPPGNPPGFSVVVKVKGPDTGYIEDIRPPGAAKEVWDLSVMVGGPPFGGSADASLPGFFPVLSWDPNVIRPLHGMELRLGDANGPVLADMKTSDTYQISEEDAEEYLPELDYATFSYTVVFETAPTIRYCRDADGDGYGDPNDSVTVEPLPPGYVLNCGDCDDSDSNTYPDAIEICDGKDNNCDGVADEGCDIESWMLEIMSIGQGDDISAVYIGIDTNGSAYPSPPIPPPEFTVILKIMECYDGCTEDIRPPGAAQEVWDLSVMVGGPTFGGSADASLPGFFPVLSWDPNEIGPVEVMDLRIGDANGPTILDMRTANTYQTQEADISDPTINYIPNPPILSYALIEYAIVFEPSLGQWWYRDADGDGYGDPSDSIQAEVQPAGYIANSEDCDDSDSNTYPDAIEICDGKDNNCDGVADEGCDIESWMLEIMSIGQGDDISAVYIGIDTNGSAYPSPPIPPPEFTVILKISECYDGCTEDIRPPGAAQEVWDLSVMVGGPTFGGSAEASLPGFFPMLSWDPNVIRPLHGMELRLGDANGPVLADMKTSDTYQISEEDAEAYLPELDYATFSYAVVFEAPPVSCKDEDKDGFTACEGDCNDYEPTIYPGADEICDNLDNNCDGQIDEGLVRDCSTACGTGTETCQNGQWVNCTAPAPPCEEVSIFTAEIKAKGQGGDTSSVKIGIDFDGKTYPYPPGNPPDFTVAVKVKGPDTGYIEDYRMPGAVQEVWALEVMVGGSAFGGAADADLPGFFPVLSWYPSEIGPAQVMDLRLGDADGPVILDMRTANTYQVLESDAEAYIPSADYALFSYAVVFEPLVSELPPIQ